MKRIVIAVVLLLCALPMSGCSTSSPAQHDDVSERNSGLAGTGWVEYAGVGVGTLADTSAQGKAIAAGARVGTYPDLDLEQMIRTAVQMAAKYHRTMVYHNAEQTRWLQTDPLVYAQQSVTVRLRIWRGEQLELELEQYRQVSLPM